MVATFASAALCHTAAKASLYDVTKFKYAVSHSWLMMEKTSSSKVPSACSMSLRNWFVYSDLFAAADTAHPELSVLGVVLVFAIIPLYLMLVHYKTLVKNAALI